MSWIHRRTVLATGIVAILLLVCLPIGVAFLRSEQQNALAAAGRNSVTETKQEPVGNGDAISVRTVNPRRDASFSASVEQPAYVAAYYQADLMVRLAGPVKSITHDIGDRAKPNEILIQIDVPDLQEDVLQKEAIITQRKDDLALTRANVQTALSGVDAAKGVVKVKESEVSMADATRNFRGKELRRFQGLASGPSPGITQDILDERTQFYEAAVAASESARATVLKAKAELEEANARLEAARADIKLKESFVEVAQRPR